MYGNIINLLLGVTFITLFVMTLTSPALAQVSTSSSFMMENTTVDTFGGVGTSSSFFQSASGDQFGGGESTSSSFMVEAGTQYYNAFTPEQQNWRWYDDENHETPTDSLSPEDTAPSTLPTSDVIKLRVAVAETSNNSENNVKFALQFATASDFSGPVVNVAEQSTCTFSSAWCYADGVDADGDIISTSLLSDSDACTGGIG